ncbi:dihydropteroate synthase [Deinococcus sp. Marseille-Q6407]|uniref:dihydropteroate synthase n=1 Tax=Deinococcus sp. Marseille-Q6407 TaxID=2969223 RepID=UPI0021C1F4B9|nr:dihydropteroate synthase [Deinococcus sp. Marseille-Q6407]
MTLAWPQRPHRLLFRRPLPSLSGVVKNGDCWQLNWTGCAVMGILNVTPDSFSDGGRHATLEAALAQAEQLRQAGALMIDVGGESTRPGSSGVSAAEEIDRVRPVVAALAERGFLISVDTLKAEVAAAALTVGAHLINDVSGLRDPQMVQVCAENGAPACLMHMQGEPRTMQHQPRYDDVVAEVHGYLRGEAERVQAAGVPDILLDPGIGFGKTVDHNLSLLRAVPELTQERWPVLIGASRKGMIGTLTGEQSPARRDPGSLALHLHAARAGAAMVRVHAVAEHVQALQVQAALDAEPLTAGAGQ